MSRWHWRGRIHERGNRPRWSGTVQGAWGKTPQTVYVLLKGNQILEGEKKINIGCSIAIEGKFGNKQTKKNLKEEKRMRWSRKRVKGIKAGNRLTDLISCSISGP